MNREDSGNLSLKKDDAEREKECVQVCCRSMVWRQKERKRERELEREREKEKERVSEKEREKESNLECFVLLIINSLDLVLIYSCLRKE